MLIYILFLVTPLKGDQTSRPRDLGNARRLSGHYYLAVGIEASLIGYMVSSFFLSVAYLWYVYYLVGYAICFRRLYDAGRSRKVHPATLAGDGSARERALKAGRWSPRSEYSGSARVNR